MFRDHKKSQRKASPRRHLREFVAPDFASYDRVYPIDTHRQQMLDKNIPHGSK